MRLLRWAVIAALVPLSGCATFHQDEVFHKKVMQNIQQLRTPKPAPVVQVENDPYLLGPVVQVQKPIPALLQQPIHLAHDSRLTLGEAAALITQATGIPVHVDVQKVSAKNTLPPLPGMGSTVLLNTGTSSHSFHWSGGTIAQLLDEITAAHRVYWKWSDGAVDIFRTETRTFQIPALDWAGSLNGSISSTSGSQAASSGSDTGPTTTGTGNMAIKNQSQVNVWKGLTKVIQTIAGHSAVVVADSSLGTVSVTGTPPQLQRVAHWVKVIGRQITRQVAVTIRVYNVRVDHEQNYGINLSGAFDQVAKNYGLTFSGASVPAVSGSATPASFGAGILSATNPSNAQFNGSQVTLQALATLGDTTMVYNQSAVTLNGEPSPIQVAKNITYLASSSTTNTANVGSSTSLTPGTLTTGFTANILPRIEGNKVLLGVNMNLSDLIQIQTITSGGSEIQAPEVYTDSFFKSVALKSGQTLVISSYAQTVGDVTHNGAGSPYVPILGGGADATHNKTMVVITITAHIL